MADRNKDYSSCETLLELDEERGEQTMGSSSDDNNNNTNSNSSIKPQRHAVLQVRNSNPTEKKSFYYQMKCRHALYLCTGILFVHIIIVTCLDVGNVDVTARTITHVRRSRSKRDADADNLIIDSQNVQAASAAAAAAAAPCYSGHVSGLPRICDYEGCLDQLAAPKDDPVTLQQLESDSHNLSLQYHMQEKHDSSYNKYSFSDGMFQSLLSVITSMQWSKDIYGSVGSLGLKKPLHSLLLASHTDTKAGEHFFVSDTFREPHHTSMLDNFLVNIKSDSKSEDYNNDKYHMHIGDVSDVSKGLLRTWNLPQFRFISIDGATDSVVLLSRLEIALCFLRDGGIISIEGLDLHEDEIFPGLRQFFSEHGTQILHPLLVTNDRVFLCTSTWINYYTSLLRDQYDVMLAFRGREITTSVYGQPVSYLLLQR